MMKDDKIIRSLMYGDIVKQIANEKNIGLTEARLLLSQMSFTQYHNLVEASADITPPSGNPLGPTSGSQQKTGQAQTGPSQVKAIWPGKGAPVEIGMTVGLKGPNGLPIPGQVSQVDMNSKGVKIKNPTTGQDEWRNTDELEPFMASGQPGQQGQNIQPGTQPGTQPTVEDAQLNRLRELAGIKENCSAGATGAGGIAVAPMPMGTVKRRQETDEQAPPKEYTPRGPAKTIVGDTKPHQASGELSANLAARGKKTASRKNNGFKK
jgi:hypothetical protein